MACVIKLNKPVKLILYRNKVGDHYLQKNTT